ncbi:hypothetical protein WJX79_009943 [Trebouxia sp. C0005]
MLHLGAVDTVDSDSDEERITYAASEHDCSERGSDSGPSVLEELPCEIRGSPGRDMAHQSHQDMPAEPPRRLQQPDIIEGDFIVVKIYKTVRKDGDRKGKSVSKAEGPYLVKGFTDATKQIAIFADANDIT